MPDEKRGNKTERRKMFIYRYHPKVLLERVKNRISELDHWTEKEETQPAVDVIIRNTLWSELPESYDDTLVNAYRQRIYEFVGSAAYFV